MSASYRRPIGTRAELLRAIGEAASLGALGEAMLLRALAEGRIAHWQCLEGSGSGTFKRYAAACANRPTVVTIPADDYSGAGPEHWPAAERAIRWSATVIVHAAAAEAQHYHAAIAAAQIVLRVLIIETDTARAADWLALVKAAPNRPPVTLIVPTGGRAHPLPVDRGALH